MKRDGGGRGAPIGGARASSLALLNRSTVMSKKKQLNQNQEAAATAKFVTTGIKIANAVEATLKTSEVVKLHPEYATRPAMKACIAEWEDAAKTLDDIE